jgi:hypothetical protein
LGWAAGVFYIGGRSLSTGDVGLGNQGLSVGKKVLG